MYKVYENSKTVLELLGDERCRVSASISTVSYANIMNKLYEIIRGKLDFIMKSKKDHDNREYLADFLSSKTEVELYELLNKEDISYIKAKFKDYIEESMVKLIFSEKNGTSKSDYSYLSRFKENSASLKKESYNNFISKIVRDLNVYLAINKRKSKGYYYFIGFNQDILKIFYYIIKREIFPNSDSIITEEKIKEKEEAISEILNRKVFYNEELYKIKKDLTFSMLEEMNSLKPKKIKLEEIVINLSVGAISTNFKYNNDIKKTEYVRDNNYEKNELLDLADHSRRMKSYSSVKDVNIVISNNEETLKNYYKDKILTIRKNIDYLFGTSENIFL